MTETLKQRPKLQGVQAARPSMVHWSAAVLMVFTLGFGAPDMWFISPSDTEGLSTTLSGLIIIALASFSVLTVLHRLPELLTLFGREWMLSAFFFLALFSVLWSSEPTSTIRQSIPLIAAMVFGAWMVMVFPLRNTLLIFGVGTACGTLLAMFFILVLPRYGINRAGQWVGLQENRNPFSRSASFSLLIFLLNASVYRPYRWIWLPLAGIAVTQVYFSTSKTSLVVAGLVLVCFVVFRLFRAKRTLYGAISVALGSSVALAVATATANLSLITDALDRDVTLTGRTDLWAESFALAMERPFLGWGFSGVWHGYFSPTHDILLAANWDPSSSHNAFLEYFLELGVVGLLLSIGIYVRAIVLSARYVRTIGHQSNLGILPMLAVTFALLVSITEVGAVSRTAYFLLLIISIFTVGKELSKPAELPAIRSALTGAAEQEPGPSNHLQEERSGAAFNA